MVSARYEYAVEFNYGVEWFASDVNTWEAAKARAEMNGTSYREIDPTGLVTREYHPTIAK